MKFGKEVQIEENSINFGAAHKMEDSRAYFLLEKNPYRGRSVQTLSLEQAFP